MIKKTPTPEVVSKYKTPNRKLVGLPMRAYLGNKKPARCGCSNASYISLVVVLYLSRSLFSLSLSLSFDLLAPSIIFVSLSLSLSLEGGGGRGRGRGGGGGRLEGSSLEVGSLEGSSPGFV